MVETTESGEHFPFIKFEPEGATTASGFPTGGLPYLACSCGWDDRGDHGWGDHLATLRSPGEPTSRDSEVVSVSVTGATEAAAALDAATTAVRQMRVDIDPAPTLYMAGGNDGIDTGPDRPTISGSAEDQSDLHLREVSRGERGEGIPPAGEPDPRHDSGEVGRSTRRDSEVARCACDDRRTPESMTVCGSCFHPQHPAFSCGVDLILATTPSRDSEVRGGLEAAAERAHDAWYAEKRDRLAALGLPLSWLSESGEEQLVPWADLSEPVREFDRIVVRAIGGYRDSEVREAIEALRKPPAHGSGRWALGWNDALDAVLELDTHSSEAAPTLDTPDKIDPSNDPECAACGHRRHSHGDEGGCYVCDEGVCPVFSASEAAPVVGLSDPLLSSRELPPLPWSSRADRQPWPNEAADPALILDANGLPIFMRNWKETCAAVEFLVRAVNRYAPDLAARLTQTRTLGETPGG